MTTKTSQKTEDMLDQTFQNFDSEQTVNTQTSSGGTPPKSGGNSNTKLIIALGVGCVLIAAYVMFLRPSASPQQPPKTNVENLATNEVKPSETVAPQVAPAPMPEPVVNVAIQTAPQGNTPNDTAAGTQTNLSNQGVQIPVETPQPVAPQIQIQTPIQVASVDIQQPSTPVTPVTNDQTQISIQPAQPTVSIDVNSSNKSNQVDVTVENQPKQVANAVIDDIVSKFDKLEKQNTEFKAIVTDIDGKLTTIQSTMTEQKDFNQKVETRLEALESKGQKPKVTANPKTENSAKVIKSKAKVEKTEVVIKEKDISEKITVKAKQPTKVDIHSVYGGRVWVKNSDGSLSTYSAGDKLPNGEIIKIVDDENLEIVTDVRVIKN